MARDLVHARASPSLETRQVLAITFLNNANLDDGTLENAKSDLIKYAKNQKEKEMSCHNSSKMIPFLALTPLMISAKELDELGVAVKSSVRRSTAETAQKFQKVNKDIQSAAQDLFKQPASTEREKRLQEVFQADEKDLHLEVDDTVMILRELNQASRSTVNPLNLHDISSLMDVGIQSSMLASNEKTGRIFGNSLHLQTRLTRGQC